MIPNIHPVYDPNENYDIHWGFADYKDKTILDLGADVGSTASWLLRHGASTITCFEGNVKYFSKLKKNLKRMPNVSAHQLMILSESDMEQVLTHPADMVKVDIEGAEQFLALVPRSLLRSHLEYVIECHTRDIAKLMRATFRGVGFKLLHEFLYLDRLPVLHFIREEQDEMVTIKKGTFILTPIYQATKWFPRVCQFLYELNPQPEKWVFLENNSTDKTLELIRDFKKPHELVRLHFTKTPCDGTFYTAHEIIAAIRQILLQQARRLDAEYAIFLDSDIVPISRNLIESLTHWGDQADIIGGPYLRSFPKEVLLDAFWHTNVPEHYQMRRTARLGCLPLEPMAIVGGGCMRLNRKIIDDERLRFYPRNKKWIPDYSEDHAFCMDAAALGYKVALDTTVQLSHAFVKDVGKPWMLGVDGKPMKFQYPSHSVMASPSQAACKK